MLSDPVRPLAAGLDADGAVRLRLSRTRPVLATRAHVPGSQLLPGALPVEQDIVWVFPALTSAPLTPIVLREHLRRAWEYLVGTVFHRAIIQYARFGPDWADGLRRAAQSAVDDLYTIRAVDLPVVDVVAGLETPIDLFGAPDHALVNAISWGFGAEYDLANAYGDLYRQTSTDIVRYRSRDAVFAQEWPLMQHRLPQLTRHYIAGAYDIVAVWNDDRSIAAAVLRDRARDLGFEFADRFEPS